MTNHPDSLKSGQIIVDSNGEKLQENNDSINDLKDTRKELIRKILVWFIVFFIVMMMILVIIFNPKFYNFVDLIKLNRLFSSYI